MLLELFPTLIAALAVDFFIYVTGVAVLKSLSFGYLKYQIFALNEYKAAKKLHKRAWYIPYLTGMLFYIALVSVIVWFLQA